MSTQIPFDGRPLVFVTVGTDHHPFNRLMHWVERWLQANGSERASFFIQAGMSVRLLGTPSSGYLGYDEMRATILRATVVVTHGGPASIMLAGYLGRKPIVVPRLKTLGEHVDDHQLVFARRLAAEGDIEVAETEERFCALVDRGLALGRPSEMRASDSGVAETVRSFEQLVDGLLAAGARGR